MPAMPSLARLEKMKPKGLANNSELKSKMRAIPIAIIGMACLLPQARNLREFWDNVVQEVDCITDVPPSGWDIDEYYDPDPGVPDKIYCKRGGFIPEIDFDPMEFGLPPNIMELTDTSQLLSLIVAKEVLEDAGYGESSSLDRDQVGIVLGVGGGQKLMHPLISRLQYPVWKKVLKKSGMSDEDTQIIIEKIKKAYIPWEENSFPGLLGNVVSGRIANRLNLGGMNCVVDAACAGSMAALKMAISELLEYRSEVVITGGVDTDNSTFMYMCFSKTPAFTKADRCRPFGRDAGGMMIGEGIAMVALKRLEDAERDNDRIYAVIRGIGASSDGRFSSIYNPRPEGQAMALRRAYRDAGIHPSTVGLVEAHGTGTTAGDPAEVAALRDVFSEGETWRQHIALGSIKSQIGHTKAAAGAAGLVKAALALHQKVLPPTINVTKPLDKLGLEHSPFYLNTETRPWLQAADDGPRRAAVSAFGFGGTNFHVVLEEYEKASEAAYRMHAVPRAFLFFAEDPEALIQECSHAIQRLESESGETHYRDLAAAGKHASRIPREAARFGFVSASRSQACKLLKRTAETLQAHGRDASWELPGGVFYRRAGMGLAGSVVALFCGQGSQYRNMGKELVYNFPPLMDAFQEMDRLFLKNGRPSLSQKVFPIPVFEQAHRNSDEEELRRTEHAQPAIGAFCAGLYRILEQAGFQPDMVAGHSFGELTALWAAKVLSDDDFFSLAVARGQAMAAPDDPDLDPGTMLAIIGDSQEVQADLRNIPNVTVANHNSKRETVVAGPTGDLAALRKALQDQRGRRLVPLPVSAAFHTPLVRHAQAPFAKAVRAAAFRQARCAVYSNSTAKPYPCDPEAIRKGLQEHMLKPVLFQEEIENIYKDGGTLFVEFGPRGILTHLVDNILEDKPHLAVALNPVPGEDSDRQLREAVVKLRVAGLSLRDIDPWHRDCAVPERKEMSRAVVKLTGANYVSEKTRDAFTNALNDGWRIRPSDAPQGMPVASVPEEIRPARKHPQAVGRADKASFAPRFPAAASPAADGQPVSDNIRHGLELFYKHQGETLELHRQYLANHKAYAQAFFELMDRQYAVLGGEPPAAVPDSVEQSMALFHTHQAETLRVHEEYLKNQAQISELALDVARRQASVITDAEPSHEKTQATAPSSHLAAPDLEVQGIQPYPVLKPEAPTVSLPEQRPSPAAWPEPAPAAAPSETAAPVAAPEPAPIEAPPPAADPGFEALTRSSLEVVSDKTGYPVEMLELDMEMEADLGIDSIKRVEILGTIMELYPDLPELNPQELAGLRTLGQIVEYMQSSLPGAAAAEQPALAAAPKPAPIEAPPPAAGPGFGALTRSSLEVVSDKTGYPVEMLELDMEMEADLGIDSIKRVEILGTIMELYPDLPELNPQELAGLRTLGQIVEYMQSSLPGAAAAEQPALAAAPKPTPIGAPPPAADPGREDLTRRLLEAVSDKTGYPVEMLELDMEMEAELGIDRIKLVEIMAALNERSLGSANADHKTLVELRTLDDLLGHMKTWQPYARDEAVLQQTEVEDRVPRAVARPRFLPAPDYLECTMPGNHICLLTDDGSRLTVALAEALEKKGWKPVVVSFAPVTIPQRLPLPQGVPRIELKDGSEKHLQETLRTVLKVHGPVAGFIHLHPADASSANNGLVFSETARDILRHVFLIAKHLKAPLTQTFPAGRRFFMTVARLDGMLGVRGNGFGAVDGGLFGLTKSLGLEWPAVYCRALDLSPELDSERAASSILRELHDPDRRIVETGYGPRGRVTLVADETGGASQDGTVTGPDASAVFLVSGGARGVTARCIVELARVFQCKFILLGRSAFDGEEPAWARGCHDESELKRRGLEDLKIKGAKPTPVKVQKLVIQVLAQREISGTLKAVREAGGQAAYVQVDVTDAQAPLKVAPVAENFGTITGIIHGAGVLADRLIEKKTVGDFDSVYGTKIDGLDTLLRCADPGRLKHLVLFSSAAGFFGNTGQSDYAAANEILNKFAYRFKHEHPACRVAAFNWGPWAGGMVTDSLKKMFAERNISLIPVSAGTKVFVDAFSSNGDKALQVLVGSSMRGAGGRLDPELRAYRVTRRLRLDANPFLHDHVIGGQPVLPTACATAWMGDVGEQVAPGYKFLRSEDQKVLNGIVFDETLAKRYIAEIREARMLDSGEVRLDVIIASHPSGDKSVPHYRAGIVLGSRIPEAPVFEHFDPPESEVVKGETLYQDGTLFHGPMFQIVDRVLDLTPHSLTMQCGRPAVGAIEQGQFPIRSFDLYTADALFQAMLIWVRRQRDAGSLPLKVQTIEQFRPVPAGQAFYVSLDVKQCTKSRLVADVFAHDATGRVYTRMLAAEVTISKQLKKVFRKASAR